MFLYQWLPDDSVVDNNLQTRIKYFGKPYANMYLIISHKNKENLLTPNTMDIMYDIYQTSINFSIDLDSSMWNFDDLCFKDCNQCQCISKQSGIFNLFQFNPTLWKNETSIYNKFITSNDDTLQVSVIICHSFFSIRIRVK